MKSERRVSFAPATRPLEDAAAEGLPARLQQEIAERQRLQRELELRDFALDAASSHFMIVDMQREGSPIVYVNQAIARAHGYERHELIGRTATCLADAASSATQLEEIRAALQAGNGIRTELRGRRKDGSTFSAGIFLGPVRDASGVITHYVAVGADITARLQDQERERQLQAQLVNEIREREQMGIKLRVAQKLEAVGQLAAGIAHEINTPTQYVGDSVYFLQSAFGDMQALLDKYRAALATLPDSALKEQLAQAEKDAGLDFLAAEIPRAFDRSLSGVARVASIVKAMKEFAHPGGHEQSPADINNAIQTTLTVAQNEYKYCATVETQFSELPQVVCNIGELNQVLLNLIINAAHAITESGKDVRHGFIHIGTETRGDMVSITIEDNGCGIPAENLDRVFDPFFTTKEVGKGTGQGLSIARTIVVEKHGGTIDVQSTVGSGTRVVVTLPVHGRNSEQQAT